MVSVHLVFEIGVLVCLSTMNSTTRSISSVANLARELIRIESITPADGGCQTVIRHRLSKIGFTCETLQYHDVTNLWAYRGDLTNEQPLLVFAGHTDVVPPGPLEAWTYPPFEGFVDDQNVLHGRGAVDMKGGIASFIIALEDFISSHPDHSRSIGVIITSDEEGKAEHGTKMVVEELLRRGIRIDISMGIIGEPSSETIGDFIKIGRRGSLGGELTIKGIMGHVAYPYQSLNPIHESLGALKDLVDMKWDDGTEDFGPTTFQISNINAGTGARNVVPGFKTVVFNFRYSPASTEEMLKSRVEKILDNHSLNYEIDWHDISLPYETDADSDLVKHALASLKEVTGVIGKTSTSGGTSDGRFLSAAGADVIELGPSFKTIHKVNEQVAIGDLECLVKIYKNLLERVCIQ